MALLADDGGDELAAQDLVDARVVGVAAQRLQLLPRHSVHAPGVSLLTQLKFLASIKRMSQFLGPKTDVELIEVLPVPTSAVSKNKNILST